RCTGRARQLRTLARLHFNAMNDGAHGNVADGQSVAGADGGILTGQDGGTYLQTARRNDVAALAIHVAHQRNMSGTVGIVLETLYLGRNVVLVATEIDDTIVLTMAATTMTHSDVTVVVATGTAEFLFKKRLVRGALVKLRVDDLDHPAATGGGWFDFNECHLAYLCKVEFLAILELDICLALVTATTQLTAKSFCFALLVQYLNGINFDLEQEFDGGLDFGLGGIACHTQGDLLVLFGDIGGLLGNDGREYHLHKTFCIHHPSISSS